MESKKSKIDKKIKMCDATYFKDKMTIIFDGYGIVCINEHELSQPVVKVEYSGKIGDSDFEYKIIK